MRNVTRLTVAAVALLSGLSVASAASMSKSTTGSASSSMATPSDTLSLTSSQQKMAWKDISGQAVKETAPATFTAKVGAARADRSRHQAGAGQHRQQGAGVAAVPVRAARQQQAADRQSDRSQGGRDHHAVAVGTSDGSARMSAAGPAVSAPVARLPENDRAEQRGKAHGRANRRAPDAMTAPEEEASARADQQAGPTDDQRDHRPTGGTPTQADVGQMACSE